MIQISDYQYHLPDERIAKFPLNPRHSSKLAVYQNGQISHHQFLNLPDFIEKGTLLVLNETKVIPARLNFVNHKGKNIEVFLLEPHDQNASAEIQLRKSGTSVWNCMIGRRKNWKKEEELSMEIEGIRLFAGYHDYENNVLEFHWQPASYSFSEVLQVFGNTPLPPYLNRDLVPTDKENYQTQYAQYEGSVAAPTAGLHFTEQVFEQLDKKGIQRDFVTLHVGAGTFVPVKTENALDHTMHREQIQISTENIRNLLKHGAQAVAVGTTSVRVLESLYWYGNQLIKNADAEFNVMQNDPYMVSKTEQASVQDALQAILRKAEAEKVEQLLGHTSIYIHPGYEFKIVKGIVTNFHQPGSTLMLLVAAFMGEDWRKLYQEALENNYRFLSYGDSSLLV